MIKFIIVEDEKEYQDITKILLIKLCLKMITTMKYKPMKIYAKA